MGSRIDIDLTALRTEMEGPAAQAEMDRIVGILQANAEEKTPPRSAGKRKVKTKGGGRVYPRSMKKGFKWSRVSPGVRRLFHQSSLYHVVEYGSANNQPYAPMRRGVQEAGLRIRSESK